MKFLRSRAFLSKVGAAARRSSKAILGTASKFTAAAVEPIGFREILLFGGAILLAIGMWSIFPPASFLIPGAILVYVSIFGTA